MRLLSFRRLSLPKQYKFVLGPVWSLRTLPGFAKPIAAMPDKALWLNSDSLQEVKIVPGGYVPQQDEMLLKCICVGFNPAD